MGRSASIWQSLANRSERSVELREALQPVSKGAISVLHDDALMPALLTMKTRKTKIDIRENSIGELE